jgi:hypothetical protein
MCATDSHVFSVKNLATLPNPDPIKCPIQRIQGIEKGFGFGFPAISPEAFGHSVEGLDGSFDISSGCWREVFLLLLGHGQNVRIGCADAEKPNPGNKKTRTRRVSCLSGRFVGSV